VQAAVLYSCVLSVMFVLYFRCRQHWLVRFGRNAKILVQQTR